MGRILSIDYGAKRTGLAWTDPLQIIATGIGSFDTSELEAKLEELFAQEQIEEIVLGYPMNWDDSDTHATPLVREFAAKLAKKFPQTPIQLWDERMTSQMAKQAIRQGGAKKKKRRDKHLVNEISAVIILQDYMRASI